MAVFVKYKLDPNDKMSTIGVSSNLDAANGAVILKVKKMGYVPEGFVVQSRIDDLIFTALGGSGAIEAARADVDVVSIAPASGVRQNG
jgi:hypothetical protein